MKTFPFWQTAAMIAAALLLASTPARAQKVVVAYVPNWIDLEKFSETIDYAKVTHLNIAFENPENDNGDLSFNQKNKFLIARAHEHKVKVSVSIGGGAASGDKVLQKRYFDLLTEPKRAGFVAKLVDYTVSHGFDGLDVDIEGPSINGDYGAFMHNLAGAMKAKGKLLTAALSKGYGGDKVPDAVFADCDFISLMAYDATGYWEPNAPGQHSSLEFAKSNIAWWLKRGLPTIRAKAKHVVDEGLAGVMI